MMLFFKTTPSPSLIVLLLITGVRAQSWGVWYNPAELCALRGSSVTFYCTYSYPWHHSLKSAFWMVDGLSDLSEDDQYKGRVKYSTYQKKNDILELVRVRDEDAAYYRFRFITDGVGKWTGSPGAELRVTGLQVVIPEKVVEGGDVTLKCNTTCRLNNSPTFIWYRNTQRLRRRNTMTDTFDLKAVSSEDAGSYSCAVQGYENDMSPSVTLTVEYPPRNVSISFEPSAEMIEGSSLTLTCSSDANPPKVTYTWFKHGSGVRIGEGGTYNISNISSEDSGEYKCKSTNEHGNQYAAGLLSVLYAPKKTVISVTPSGDIVEGSSVTLSCSSDAKPAGTYSWFKENTFLRQGESYQIDIIRPYNSGSYKCKSMNVYGLQYSAVYLDVSYSPKRTSVSVSPSAEVVEGSSVTLTCSSDAKPQVVNYTWFRDSGTSPVGSGKNYVISNFSLRSSGWYHCKACNKHGTQSSSAVAITLKQGPRYAVYAVSGTAAGFAFILLGIFLVKKERDRRTAKRCPKQDNIYDNIFSGVSTSNADPHTPDPAIQNDVQNAAFVEREPHISERSSTVPSEELYCNNLFPHDDEIGGSPDDILYASIKFQSLERRAVETEEDPSVIYSSVVKKPRGTL